MRVLKTISLISSTSTHLSLILSLVCLTAFVTSSLNRDDHEVDFRAFDWSLQNYEVSDWWIPRQIPWLKLSLWPSHSFEANFTTAVPLGFPSSLSISLMSFTEQSWRNLMMSSSLTVQTIPESLTKPGPDLNKQSWIIYAVIFQNFSKGTLFEMEVEHW